MYFISAKVKANVLKDVSQSLEEKPDQKTWNLHYQTDFHEDYMVIL